MLASQGNCLFFPNPLRIVLVEIPSDIGYVRAQALIVQPGVDCAVVTEAEAPKAEPSTEENTEP